MQRSLAPLLICPCCLPREIPLQLSVDREADGDVLAGTLSCRGCRKRFPVRDGIAVLAPDPVAATQGAQMRYEEGGTLDSYLWSHFGELLGEPEANTAYAGWSAQLAATGGLGLDAGCAVGRITFELAALTELAVGCDLSFGFIRTARRLARERGITFSLPLEGKLREEWTLRLPERLPAERAEFLVADALRLPFAAETFRQGVSLNLLDRVAYPLAHLYEMNRVCANEGSRFLFSSPFSWSASSTQEERWLGGTTEGKYAGRGIDNVRDLLEGKEGVISPPWRVDAQGSVRWRLRSHANHFEEIRSLFLAACR